MLPRSTALAMAILAAASTTALAATPAPLALDQQVRGEITSADAINWRDGSRSELYSIHLDEGQGVRFEVQGPLRAQLSLFRDGELVQASAEGREMASLAARLPRAGRYVLAVSGSDASAYGPYTLKATAMQVYAGGELVPPASITDWAQAPRTIPLRIASAGMYRIRMSSDDFDTVLSLEGEGLSLRSDDADGSNSMLTAQLQPGSYTLRASGFQDQVEGEYRLSVAMHQLDDGVLPATGGELVPGTAITALYQGQPVAYRLHLDGRKLVELDMQSSEIDPGLVLEGNGVSLEDDDSGERLDARIATVLEAGDYTVRASAFDAGAGVFTLSAQVSDVPTDAGGGVLQAGRMREARLIAGAADRYTFSIQREGTYRVEMSSDDGVDSHLRLSRDGEVVAADDDGGGGFDARIEEHLQPGDYVLEASSAVGGEGGRYRIGVHRR
ncbi:MAG TPA: hypothetical protein VIG97_03940 [Luteimonas sp.]